MDFIYTDDINNLCVLLAFQIHVAHKMNERNKKKKWRLREKIEAGWQAH